MRITTSTRAIGLWELSSFSNTYIYYLYERESAGRSQYGHNWLHVFYIYSYHLADTIQI